MAISSWPLIVTKLVSAREFRIENDISEVMLTNRIGHLSSSIHHPSYSIGDNVLGQSQCKLIVSAWRQNRSRNGNPMQDRHVPLDVDMIFDDISCSGFMASKLSRYNLKEKQ